jgi:putative membrane protein
VIALADGEPLPPFSPAVLFTRAEPVNLAIAVVVAAAVLYGIGVWRLARRGIAWPVGRTVGFGAGLLTLGIATGSGLEAYDTTLLSTHMVQHMLLGMVGPILLALGAPVTLALRTLTPGPRRTLLAVMHSRVAAVFTFPLVSFGLFVASPFALYFSGLYRASLEYPWVHELVHAHFVIVGCLFFWPLIGIDPVPGRMSYPLRALIAFLATPFHTVLGLTIMQSSSLLGGDWYPNLHLTWSDAHADQNLGGGILWAGGEFVAVAVLGAMVVQWMRESEREAARIDRALDRAEAEAAAEAAQAALAADAQSGPVVDLGGQVGSSGSYEAETHR